MTSEGFLRGLEVYSDGGQEGLVLRCPVGVTSGRSSSCPPSLLIRVFMPFDLCTGARSCWDRPGLSTKQFPQRQEHEMIPNIWCAEALRLPFGESTRPGSSPGNPPHAIIPTSTKLFTCCDAVRHAPSPGQTAPSDHQTGKTWFIVPEDGSPSLCAFKAAAPSVKRCCSEGHMKCVKWIHHYFAKVCRNGVGSGGQ